MIGVKFHPCLVIGCVLATILFFVSLRTHVTGASVFSNQPTSSENVNYKSASPRKQIDTTSEIGRASNATLGVQTYFPFKVPEHLLITFRLV